MEKFLDDVREHFAVSDDSPDVVGRVDRNYEQPNLVHRAGDSAGRHEVSHLEGLQNNQQHPDGEIAEQSAPGHADGYAAAASRAAKLVVSTPKKLRMATTTTIFRMAATVSLM